MFKELYRVLAPGGRFLTFSLHSIDEVRVYFDMVSELDWKFTVQRVKSSRWNPDANRRRNVACTVVICDKINSDGTYNLFNSRKNFLTDSQYLELERISDEVCLFFSQTNDLF